MKTNIQLFLMLLFSACNITAATHFEFHPREYVSTDNSRAPQSAFRYNDAAGTFSISATGQNNIAFQMNGDQDDKYYITSDDHYLVVTGSGLRTNHTDSYLWWINGWNRGTQVSPDYTTAADGKQYFVWDLTNGNSLFSAFDFSQQQIVLNSSGTNILLAMGFTATNAVGTISDIGFLSLLDIAVKYPQLMSAMGITNQTLINNTRSQIQTLIASAQTTMQERGGTETERAPLLEAINQANKAADNLNIQNIADTKQVLADLQSAIDEYIINTRQFSFQKTPRGITAQLDDMKLNISFFNDSTLHITKHANGISLPASLVVTTPEDIAPQLSYTTSDETVAIESATLRLVYNLRHGTIQCFRLSGELLISESTSSITPTQDGPNASYRLRQQFTLANDEQIYGLGQIQNGKLSMRGTSHNMVEENRSIYIPYFYSSKRYGLYWDNYSPTQFVDNNDGATFTSTGLGIDYYILAGTSSGGVLHSLRHLTGETQLPPLWNFGLYQSKQRYMSTDEVIDVVRRYRQQHVPLDCVVQDWQYWGGDNMWNAMEFLNPKYADYQRMIDEVHQMNAKLMISVWANFGSDTKQFKEFADAGRLITIPSYPGGQSTRPYDVYSSATRNRFWTYLMNGIMSKGIDALWLDSSEPDDFSNRTTDYDYVTGLDNRTFRNLRNAFPLCHVEGVYDHHRAEPTLADKRVSILTRSAFLGMQRTGAFVWSADITSSWETLANQIPAACNLSVCGLPYWNSDTGAFFIGQYNGGVNNAAWRRLYTRWTQFSCFCPMMRFHGDQTPREIWQFGEAGDSRGDYDNILRYIRLRYRLLPYLYATAHEVVTQSATFMQALPVCFEADKGCADVKDQYMFGRSFLVAPVVTDGAARRNVYLPAGNKWYDFWTGVIQEGGHSISRETPSDIMPLYIPAGTILPWGPDVQYSTERPWDDIELRIYAGNDGHFTLYEDHFDGYDYQQGQFTEIPISWDESTQTLTIHERKGSFEGMLQNRKFRIVRVSTTNGIADGESNPDTTVTYTGKSLSIYLPGSITTRKLTDITPLYISNPSFEADGRTLNHQAPTGWTVDSNTAWWGVNTGGGDGDPIATDGSYIFGVWDAMSTNKPVEIYQTLTSLPAGGYRLSVDMHASNRSNVIRLGEQSLFAGTHSVLFKDQISTAGEGDDYPMQPLTLDFTLTEDENDIRIGVSTHGAPAETWFKIDNFRLYTLEQQTTYVTSIGHINTDKQRTSLSRRYNVSGQPLMTTSGNPVSPNVVIFDGIKVMEH